MELSIYEMDQSKITNVQSIHAEDERKLNVHCKNNPKFNDYLGLDCEHHSHYTKSCRDTWIVGYPTKSIESLIINCPKACKLCGAETAVNMELEEKTNIKDHQPHKESCSDDKDFRDRLGMNCRQYSAIYDCGMFASVVGFSSPDIQQLLQKCPKSCGICSTPPTSSPETSPKSTPSFTPSLFPSVVTTKRKFSDGVGEILTRATCRDNNTFTDWNGLRCKDFQDLNCSLLESIGYKNVETILEECPMSCHSCSKGIERTNEIDCQDNVAFKDSKGLTCEHHKFITHCDTIDFWGYTNEDVDIIRQNCPVTCGDCTIWTKGPTEYPTENYFPSWSPSFQLASEEVTVNKMSVPKDFHQEKFKNASLQPIVTSIDITGVVVVVALAMLLAVFFVFRNSRNCRRLEDRCSVSNDIILDDIQGVYSNNGVVMQNPSSNSYSSEITERISNKRCNLGPLFRHDNFNNPTVQESIDSQDSRSETTTSEMEYGSVGAANDFLHHLNNWKRSLLLDGTNVNQNVMEEGNIKGILKKPSFKKVIADRDYTHEPPVMQCPLNKPSDIGCL